MVLSALHILFYLIINTHIGLENGSLLILRFISQVYTQLSGPRSSGNQCALASEDKTLANPQMLEGSS